MIGHEGRYEVIAVVIAGLAAKEKRDAGLRTGALQQFGTKLFGQERIGIADIDQEIGNRAPSSISATVSCLRQASRASPR